MSPGRIRPGRCRIPPHRTRPACGILPQVWDRGRRTSAVQDLTSGATRAPTPSRGSRTGKPRPDHGDAESLRIKRDRATGRDSARAQLTPLPQGVGSLLGRAGEARSGFCREVKRRHARSSINEGHRRLTSRQVPDCLRGPAEERAHPRNPTTPNVNPPHQRQHPREPGTLSERRARQRRFSILKPQPTRQRNGWAGGQTNLGDAKRPPTPHDHPEPTSHHIPPAPRRSSTRSRHRALAAASTSR